MQCLMKIGIVEDLFFDAITGDKFNNVSAKTKS